MKRGIVTIIVALIVLVIIMGCAKEEEPKISETESETEISKKTKQQFIAYEVLRLWTPQRDGIGMIILVSEEATKEEVLAFAQHLKAKNISKEWIWIDIFDSKEAYLHRDDPNYPEKTYSKHWLVQIFQNRKTGEDRIDWIAEGREH